MWMSVCRKCEWTSGETYLKSVAEAIGRVHEEDNAGHTVEMKQVSTFGGGPEGKDDPKPGGPASSTS